MGMPFTVPRYTVQDLENFPDDGNRYELLNGILLVSPLPELPHQGISTHLASVLYSALRGPGYAKVFAPGAVVLEPHTQLEPDILVVPPHYTLRNNWKEVTEYWLAIEVLSASTHMYDRNYKRDAYLQIGVREVWLVDPQHKLVEVSRKPGEFETFRDSVTFQSDKLPVSITINLNELFAGLP